jgi:hypothetical protein
MRHEPSVPRTWTREDVRGAILAWTEEHRCAPSYRDWTPSRHWPSLWELESPRWPSASAVCRLYAGQPDPWNAALSDAGAGHRHRRWSDAAVRLALANAWTRLGRPPVPGDVAAAEWDGPSAQTLRRRYGGLAAAWRALGPVPGLQAPDDAGTHGRGAKRSTAPA